MAQSTITLYGSRLSPFSLSARVLTCEAGRQVTHRELDLGAGDQRDPAYLALNPLGSVPFLEDGLLRLSESGAILRYLARAWQLGSWYPEDPVAASLVDQWLDYNQAQYWRGLWFLFMNEASGEAGGEEPFGANTCAGAERAVERQLATLAWALEHHPFVTGPEPTIADLAIAGVLSFGMQVYPHIDETPAVADYLRRVTDRPAWVEALTIGEAPDVSRSADWDLRV